MIIFTLYLDGLETYLALFTGQFDILKMTITFL